MLFPSPSLSIEVNAAKLSRFAAAAYTDSTVSSDLDIHAATYESDDVFVVAFRGTASMRNWMTDADVIMAPFGDFQGIKLRAHNGFRQAFLSIRDKLEITISKPVYVTGHSLGGALARQLAVDFLLKRYPLAAVVTFGEPRSLDALTAKIFDNSFSRSLRVVHACDIVPRVPVWAPWHRFRHTSDNLFIDALGICHRNLPEWWRLPSDVFDIWQHVRARGYLGLAEPVNNHRIEDYVEVLNRNDSSNVN